MSFKINFDLARTTGLMFAAPIKGLQRWEDYEQPAPLSWIYPSITWLDFELEDQLAGCVGFDVESVADIDCQSLIDEEGPHDDASVDGSVLADLHPKPLVSERFAIPLLREGSWESIWRVAKFHVLRAVGFGHVVGEWKRDNEFRNAVSEEMRLTLPLPADKSIQQVVVEHVHRMNSTQVHHVPRLVAQVTVALRMKLGLGAMDRSVAGNVAVVRAEAAKMLREWNVRNVDAAAHLLEIERCFFRDDTHYAITNWRARAISSSRFLRWFLGKEEHVSFDY